MPLDDADLSKQTFNELYLAREKASPEEQARLAPFEHRAFAREFVRDNPVRNALSLGVAIPAYTAAKALGIIKGTRSPASLEEVKQGYKGVGEGLALGVQDAKKAVKRTGKRLYKSARELLE